MQGVGHGRPVVADPSAHGDGNLFATGVFLDGQHWTAAATIPAVTSTADGTAQLAGRSTRSRC